MSFGDYDALGMGDHPPPVVVTISSAGRQANTAPISSSTPLSTWPPASTSTSTASDALSRQIFQISSNVTNLASLVKQLGTTSDTETLRTRLHTLTDATRNLVKDTNIALKSLAKDGILYKKLSREFEEVLKRFQSVSKLSAERTREFLSRAKATPHLESSYQHSTESTPLLLSAPQHQRQASALDPEIEYNEALIAEREDDIKDIERNIVEVNEIFRDLGTIVVEQGDMLDHIESNILNVTGNMDGAVSEIRKANSLQKSMRNWKCWVLLILAILLFVLLIVFRPWKR